MPEGSGEGGVPSEGMPAFVREADARLARGDLAGAVDALRGGLGTGADDPRTLALGILRLARVQVLSGAYHEAWAGASEVLALAAGEDLDAQAEVLRDESVSEAVRGRVDADDVFLRRVLREFAVLSVVADLMATRGDGDPGPALRAEGFVLRPDEAEELEVVAAQVGDASTAAVRAAFAWAVSARALADLGPGAGGLPARLDLVRERFSLPDDEFRLFTLAALAAVHPEVARLVRLCGRDPLGGGATLADLLRLTQAGDPADAFGRVLSPNSALRRFGMVEVASGSPLAAPCPLAADLCEALLSGDALSGIDGLGRVVPALVAVADVCVAEDARERVRGAWEAAMAAGETAVLVLSGRPGIGRKTLAAALAEEWAVRVFAVRWDDAAAALGAAGPDRLAAALARAARLASLSIYLDVPPAPEVPGVPRDGPLARPELDAPARVAARVAARVSTPVVLGVPPGAEFDASRLPGALMIDVPLPDRSAMAVLVENLLQDADLSEAARRAVTEAAVVPGDAASLCGRLRRARDAGLADLGAEAFRASRRRAAGDFGAYATRMTPGFTTEDLVAPPELKERLNEMISFHRHRKTVFEAWGFGRKLPYGRALSALFSGPPGTGKTMAATIVASELGLDLFRVDLSQIVSKYVGETEKALSRVFEAASRTRGMLLFDEAEALFGKRGEVRSGTDRYANLEVNFLLQMMEDFDGVTILTSNHPQNIDEAFKRRLRFRIKFPFPDEGLRKSLWLAMIPPEAPVDPDLDVEVLAREFEMAGAHIKNAVVRAAFAAARVGGPLTEAGLLGAARLEYEELGRVVRTPTE